MSAAAWIVDTSRSWRLFRAGRSGEPELVTTLKESREADWGQLLPDALHHHGYRGEPVLIGIAGRDCLPVPSNLETARDQGGAALAYAAEQHLPLAAEQFVLCLVGSAPRSLALAMPVGRWTAWLEEWEAAGIDVRVVTPWALLGLQVWIRETEHTGRVDWHDAETSVFSIRSKQLTRWTCLPSEQKSVDAAESLCGLTQPVDENTAYVDDIRDEGDAQAARLPQHYSLRGARDAVLGRVTPWINFRVGILSQKDPLRPLRAQLLRLAISLLLSILGASAALQLRAAQYESRAKELTAEQAKIYAEVFPGQRTPSAIRSRLQSEHRRILLENRPDRSAESILPASITLTKILNAIPTKTRTRINSLQIDGATGVMDCEVRSLTDASALQKALEAAGLKVAPPRTEVIGEIVPLRISLQDPVAGDGGPKTGASP